MVPDEREPRTAADPARLDAARREVERFAHDKGATLIEDAPGRWRIERRPRFFKLGIYTWTAELRADGGVVISERQWRPDPDAAGTPG
jgi:hypothetical protein